MGFDVDEVEYEELVDRFESLRAENARLRERAERAEAERDALVESCSKQYHNGRWGVHLGNYHVGIFETKAEATKALFDCLGPDALTAGEGSGASIPKLEGKIRVGDEFEWCPEGQEVWPWHYCRIRVTAICSWGEQDLLETEDEDDDPEAGAAIEAVNVKTGFSEWNSLHRFREMCRRVPAKEER